MIGRFQCEFGPTQIDFGVYSDTIIIYSRLHPSWDVDENSLICQDPATAKTTPVNAFLELVLIIFLLPFRIYIINNQYVNFLENRFR